MASERSTDTDELLDTLIDAPKKRRVISKETPNRKKGSRASRDAIAREGQPLREPRPRFDDGDRRHAQRRRFSRAHRTRVQEDVQKALVQEGGHVQSNETQGFLRRVALGALTNDQISCLSMSSSQGKHIAGMYEHIQICSCMLAICIPYVYIYTYTYIHTNKPHNMSISQRIENSPSPTLAYSLTCVCECRTCF